MSCRSRSERSTSAADTVVNEVQLIYNAFGLLVTDYQEHVGPVNLNSSLKVGYTYSDGSANHARRTAVAYPNGRVQVIASIIHNIRSSFLGIGHSSCGLSHTLAGWRLAVPWANA